MIWFVCLFRTHSLQNARKFLHWKFLKSCLFDEIFENFGLKHILTFMILQIQPSDRWFYTSIKFSVICRQKQMCPCSVACCFSFVGIIYSSFQKRKRQRNIRMAWDKLRCMLTKHIESPGSMHLKPKLVAIKKHFCQIFTYLFEIEPF